MREVIAERELTESLNTPLSPTAAMQPQTDDMYAIQATVGTRTRSYLQRRRKKEEKGKDEKKLAKARASCTRDGVANFELPLPTRCIVRVCQLVAPALTLQPSKLKRLQRLAPVNLVVDCCAALLRKML
jgi:hypothetical protein